MQETVGPPKLLGVTTVPIIPFCFHLQPGTPPVVRSHDGAHGLCLRALPTLRLARKLSDFAPLRPLQRNLRSFRNEKKQPVLGYSHSQFPITRAVAGQRQSCGGVVCSGLLVRYRHRLSFPCDPCWQSSRLGWRFVCNASCRGADPSANRRSSRPHPSCTRNLGASDRHRSTPVRISCAEWQPAPSLR